MSRRPAVVVAVLYGAACHLAFVGAVGAMIVVLYGGMAGAAGRLPAPWSWIADAALLAQFPLLHSALLSRRGGAVLRRMAPRRLAGPLQSTSYVLVASMQTGLLFLAWTPVGHLLWAAEGGVRVALTLGYAAAWLLLLRAIVDAGFALQTGLLGWWSVVRNRAPAYPPMPTGGLFRWTRQPIYVAFALTLWTVPTVTTDGLAVSVVLTGYCLTGPLLKEARFRQRYGAAFARYRAAVPYWLPAGLMRARARRSDICSPPACSPPDGRQRVAAQRYGERPDRLRPATDPDADVESGGMQSR